jgi:hypothetical protein
MKIFRLSNVHTVQSIHLLIEYVYIVVGTKVNRLLLSRARSLPFWMHKSLNDLLLQKVFLPVCFWVDEH